MKKRIMALLTVLVLALSPMAVFGAEAELPQLTIKEALNKAVNHSSDLKKSAEARAEAEYTVDKARDKMNEAVLSSVYVSAYTGMLNAQMQLAMYETNTQIMKEKMEYNLTRTFANIILAEKSLELQDKSLQQQKNNLEISHLRLQLGLISQSEYDTAKNNYETNEAERANTVISIDQAYRSLNDSMGQNLDKKYLLVLDEPTYEAIKDSYSIDTAVNRALEASAREGTVKTKQQAYNNAQYTSNSTFNYNEYTGVYDGSAKISAENTAASASRDLDTAKTNLKSEILSQYDTVVQYELDYASTAQSLTQKKADLEILKTKLELGMTTTLAVEAAELEIENLELTLLRTVYNHSVGVMPLKNLRLLNNY